MEYADDLERIGVGKIKHLVGRHVVEANPAWQQVLADVADAGVPGQQGKGVKQTLFHFEAPSPGTSALGEIPEHDFEVFFGEGSEDVAH